MAEGFSPAIFFVLSLVSSSKERTSDYPLYSTLGLVAWQKFEEWRRLKY